MIGFSNTVSLCLSRLAAIGGRPKGTALTVPSAPPQMRRGRRGAVDQALKVQGLIEKW
jgi:hypothetical protein